MAPLTASAVTTIRLHGAPTLAQVARGIGRAKLGWAEIRDAAGKGTNAGPICAWSREGMYGHDGQAWCSCFACQTVRRAILEMGPAGESMLEEWNHIATGDCDELWIRLEARGLVRLHVPGQAPPAGAFFVFFITLDEQKQPVFHATGKPNLRHVGLVDEPLEGEPPPPPDHFRTIEGNSGDRVAQHTYDFEHVGLHSYALLPWPDPTEPAAAP